MITEEQENLEALRIGFECTEWEDFLLVLNEIRARDKEIIKLYRKSFIKLKELRKLKKPERLINYEVSKMRYLEYVDELENYVSKIEALAEKRENDDKP